MLIDYYSNHKNLIRFITAKKVNSVNNINNIPKIINIVYKFRLCKLDDLDDIQIYNYVYLFKFFMGRRALLTKYKSYFNLGIWTYSLHICMFVTNNRQIYRNFYLYLNHYLFVTENLFFNSYKLKKNLSIFSIRLRDLSTLTDRKTNLGLFHISTNLYKLTRLQCSKNSIFIFLNNLKMKKIKR